MDLSITRITPAVQRERGAHAFDQGLGLGDHGLTDTPGIVQWTAGYIKRQRELELSRKAGQVPGQQLAEVSPP